MAHVAVPKRPTRHMVARTGGWLYALVATVFGLAGNAAARDLIASSGNWSVYKVDTYTLAVGDGERVAIDGACVAETVADGVRLDFITLIPDKNPGRVPFYGSVIVQASSSSWSFPPRQATLSLVSGALNLTVAGSLYDFDTVNFNMGGYGKLPVGLRVFVHMASEPIEIVDDADVPVATFPSSGLLETFNEMLNCGTI